MRSDRAHHIGALWGELLTERNWPFEARASRDAFLKARSGMRTALRQLVPEPDAVAAVYMNGSPVVLALCGDALYEVRGQVDKALVSGAEVRRTPIVPERCRASAVSEYREVDGFAQRMTVWSFDIGGAKVKFATEAFEDEDAAPLPERLALKLAIATGWIPPFDEVGVNHDTASAPAGVPRRYAA